MFGDRIPIRKGDNEWNWEAEENGDDLTIKKNERRTVAATVLYRHRNGYASAIDEDPWLL